ncbi:MAG: peptidase [Pirellulales bacterium]
MSRRNRTWLRSTLWSAAWVALALQCAVPAFGSTILLKDGRTLRGRIGRTAGMAENPLKPDSEGPPTITFVDDDLRRIFVPTFRIKELLEADTGEVPERIAIKQSVASQGYQMRSVGPILKTTPFSEYGRRTLTMNTNKGPLEVIQGITMITPEWTKVEGMRTSSRQPIMWDMRIATSSIPTETLEAILSHTINPKSIDQRIKVVRLLLQCERYKEAQQKLEQIVKDFPEESQLSSQVRALRQMNARNILAEIDVRIDARQHALAYSLLERFPSEDIAGEILQQVKEMIDEYKQQQATLKRTYDELKAHIGAMSEGAQCEQCEAMLDEMGRELGLNSISRLADYLRLRDDAKLSGEQKVSLAISGWLLGPNRGDTNLAITLSLVQVRELVRRYLNEAGKVNRDQLLEQINANEGASAPQIAKLLANMKPPLETPLPSREQPGLYELTVPVGIPDEPDVTSFVQLPPQYDPFVRYPTIVTLNGAGTTPLQQIDWWAGASNDDGKRLGQATRFGYIVIAVDWAKTAQTQHGFTAREHSAVLTSLRDACRRFSIDTDRVYLSGHSMGGTAAWDIGLAHPDTWAGVIPVVAEVDKYCSRYWENAAHVPFYFVAGELDGDKTIKNAADLNRYMRGRFDVTVSEYIGRGHEDFYEDIRNMFDWMSRRQRDFFPKEFTVSTMRPWDNYFWWFEGSDFPERAMVDPVQWPPDRGVRPLSITGKRTANNGVSLSAGDCTTTLWLSPEMVDFNQRVPITVNGRTLKSGGAMIEPDLAVLLEDARTRADRLHPFWAKVDTR